MGCSCDNGFVIPYQKMFRHPVTVSYSEYMPYDIVSYKTRVLNESIDFFPNSILSIVG